MSVTGCFCTGKCKELGYCPNQPRSDYRPIDWGNLNFRPWLEPKDIPNPEKWTIKPKINCIHPEHNPPSHLYVESGHYYFHVCPSCKMQFLISGPPISL